MRLENIKSDKTPTVQKFTMVSLFSGAGGLDIGFENKGIHTIWANDIDKDACETHSSWSDAKIVHGDISKINLSDIPDSDIISGGFPCQGFSLAGPRRIDDARNILYRYFVRLVETKQPYIFVAENVKGILTLGDGTIIEAIVEDFSSRGYNVFPSLVNAADYGVPQDRWRVILTGFRKDMGIREYEFPKPFGYKVTLKETLEAVPEPKADDICQGSFSSRYMSRNRKRGWNDVSYTIPAMGKQVTLHPSSPDMIKIGEDLWEFGSGSETRRFSWQEAAAIQTFPENITFAGNLTSKYKQIGNAVPVKLAEVIADDVKRILQDYLSSSTEKAVKKIPNQSQKGKAFEYACLKTLEDGLSSSQNVVVDKSPAYKTSYGFYKGIDPYSAADMDKAAQAAYRIIIMLEPQLENPDKNIPLFLSVQEDAKGIAGDVRDVLCRREQNDWQIGLSCKHNHTAVKHSRLSGKLDFGKQWLDIPCSNIYFDEIKPLFDFLLEMKAKKKKWSEIDDKEAVVYQPLLDAFAAELNRIYQSNDDVPALLLKYLLGRNDFYKVITNDSKKLTQIQAYNIFGTLNRPSAQVKPKTKVQQLKLPTKFFDISYKENSKSTVIVTCDNGWAVSFRIHNASTYVEPSLKFDVQLVGIPPLMHTQIEPW